MSYDKDCGYCKPPVKGLARMTGAIGLVQCHEFTVASIHVQLRKKLWPKLGEYVADYKKAEAAGDQAELDKQRFPRAACLIDVLRLTLAVNSAKQILEAFEALENHARTHDDFRIMRCGGRMPGART